LSEEDRIVVVGASAGGVDTLMKFVRTIPPAFPAPICIVLHVPPDSPSLLAQILDREGMLPAKAAEDGEIYRPGHIYVAPPDRHLLIGRDGTLHLRRGPRENRHRPAVDPLFRSAALAYGSRAVGVILSGTLDDGTAGLLAIKQRGGIAIVQDPADALYPSMPQSALHHVDVDHSTPLSRLGVLLTHVVSQPPPAVTHGETPDLEMETLMAELDRNALQGDDRPRSIVASPCGRGVGARTRLARHAFRGERA